MDESKTNFLKAIQTVLYDRTNNSSGLVNY